ncbi:glycosyltransferase family 15 protein [Babjeviella inositovora NRRL Y-12698]|uniref:Glycosyltransferase family 15 protein n=1 Tax=Babjeviella inositovora NRRL Y-12698 TaxID=984486 RepID=A0A1E3QNX2_9ASCO|nr:glycosyltransferase family 15 protein [Babjeviella inositovora NRRL Y-12698]ODQ78677.1 glycosyltransferase family 15 protein [Babjeviella inositovora NRRL Y-12698]
MKYGWSMALSAVLLAHFCFWWYTNGVIDRFVAAFTKHIATTKLAEFPHPDFSLSEPPSEYARENATFVTLCRNYETYEMLESIQIVEDRFNHKYHYDWVFLNDNEFTPEFRSAVAAVVSGTAYFGRVPERHWGYPDWINQTYAAEVRQQMENDEIIYGGSESYRHMCRFESGFFFHHPIVQRYKYYWRVEPGIKLYCDIDYDVFKMMRQAGKKYGFAISLYEYSNTIALLWSTVLNFMKANMDMINTGDDSMNEFILDYGYDNESVEKPHPLQASYNLCHFWTNFEIADMDFFRSEQYTRLFEYLDLSGGFFYERWGDAPVHSIAVGLFLNKSEVHWFGDVGYYHVPYMLCPLDYGLRLKNRCSCDPRKDFSFEMYSCTGHFLDITGQQKPLLSV